ncbi:RNase P subunit p30 domain containing protein [Naviculisporaceae sp. PSN 640]
MLYDLNIAWSPTTPAHELEQTLRFAKNLGYDVVALNHQISNGSIPNLPNQIINPIPQLTPPHSSFPGGASLPSVSTKPGTVTNLSTTAASSSITTSSSSASLPTVLRRATIIINDPATTNYRVADFTRAYDLVALRPTNEKAFSWACLQVTEVPAIISLDFTTFLGYHIHHRTAMAAVHRGSRFEICYSQVLGGVDSRARSSFIGNVLSLVRATKGRGIIVSSEARNALGLRGPADVVNLLAVWGLGPEKGTEAMGVGARAVVVNEGVRRRGFRGVVDILKTAEGGENLAPDDDGEQDGTGNGKGAGKNQGKQQQQKGNKQQQQGKNQNQKRKNGDADGTGIGGAADGMSKRQAKKMRKEGAKGP